ncbi:8857_t:CDS:2 [Diversispora eburnea]|uniref:8857_t:CDS:1 n=1 Tax=Diversispora eburnea TaxID=1213867 RepID=A0A9N8Z3X7_9GLOM|nr:8857_t:CDS:2 [Diversispora eburnea]
MNRDINYAWKPTEKNSGSVLSPPISHPIKNKKLNERITVTDLRAFKIEKRELIRPNQSCFILLKLKVTCYDAKVGVEESVVSKPVTLMFQNLKKSCVVIKK